MNKKQNEKHLSKKEIEQTTFRVCCVHPLMDIEGGAIVLQSRINRLCGHGHGMTVREMNKNLIWKGRPYIHIPYCKYCYKDNTIGVLDDTAQLLGWIIYSPDEENPKFRLEKLSKAALQRVIKSFKKHRRI